MINFQKHHILSYTNHQQAITLMVATQTLSVKNHLDTEMVASIHFIASWKNIFQCKGSVFLKSKHQLWMKDSMEYISKKKLCTINFKKVF